MLAIIIDKGNSWLLNVSDNKDIDAKVLADEFSKRYMGWLINNQGITELVMQMPISRFILKDLSGEYIELTREKAQILYQMMEEYVQNKLNKHVPKK